MVGGNTDQYGNHIFESVYGVGLSPLGVVVVLAGPILAVLAVLWRFNVKTRNIHTVIGLISTIILPISDYFSDLTYILVNP